VPTADNAARARSTAIYADATGPEEKQLAERMWA
jgi:hypothetical protein